MYSINDYVRDIYGHIRNVDINYVVRIKNILFLSIMIYYFLIIFFHSTHYSFVIKEFLFCFVVFNFINPARSTSGDTPNPEHR